jgi:uncharacterized protein (TIGR03083 family)
VARGTISSVEIREHIDQLELQGKALAAAAARAGFEADVPTCPGWKVRNLIEHTGKVHRWAATYVRDGRAAFGGQAPKMEKPPAEGTLDWFVGGHAALVAALRAASPDLDAWSFLPAPSPLAFWARRQAHETAIHRADGDSACGTAPTYDPAFAADGIAELLGGFYARKGGTLTADPPRSLLVRPRDAGPVWHVRINQTGREIGNDPDVPADCTLRGAASDLYLLLWNRRPVGPVEVTGDEEVMRIWRERAQVKLR